MSYTLSDLQLDIALALGETSAPSTTSDEYISRLAYANRALRDWSFRHRWNKLKRSDNTLTTTNGLNYVALPSTFDENSISGVIQVNGSNYTLVPIDQRLFSPLDAQIAWIEYDSTTDLFRLVFNTTFDGVYTVKINYSVVPTKLTSGTDNIIVQNPHWLVRQTVGYGYMESQDSELAAYGSTILQLNEQLLQEMIERDKRGNPSTTFEVFNTFDLVGAGHGIS